MANLNKLKKERELEVYQAYLAILIQEKICEIMEKKDISQRELAKRTGLGEAAVSRLLSDDRNLTLKTVSRVFHALGEKVEILTASEVFALKSRRSVVVKVKLDTPQYHTRSQFNRHRLLRKQIPPAALGESYVYGIRPAS